MTIARLVENCMEDDETRLLLMKESHKKYRWCLRAFAKWMGEDATPDRITDRTRRDYLIFVQKSQTDGGHGYGPNMVRIISAAVVFFYKWLLVNPVSEDGSAVTPYLRAMPNDHHLIKLPKVKRPSRPATTPEMAKAMITAASNIENEYAAALLRAMITLFNDCPLRLRELLDLELRDVNLDTKEVKIRHGKGDKERSNFMSDDGVAALRHYLEKRVEGSPCLWVHPVQRETITLVGGIETTIPRHVGEKWVYQMITYLAEAAGIIDRKKVNPHAFRRGTSQRFRKAGMDLVAIMKMLGHESLETTRIYLEVYEEELFESRNMARLFPEDQPAPAVPPVPIPPLSSPADRSLPALPVGPTTTVVFQIPPQI